MKLATIQYENKSAAARVEGENYVVIPGYTTVGELIQQPNWRSVAESATGTEVAAENLVLLSPNPAPSKILCVGLNYKSHIQEMGRDLPEYPTLFAKFPDTLTGPFDPIEAVAEDAALDWEGELVVVIGKRARRVSEEEAGEHILGYTVANDISMRTWQFRTKEWLQGKMWDRSTPIGPYVVTAGDFDYRSQRLTTTVNGTVMQDHPTGDLLFTPEYLVAYLSTMITLNPGDMILTGTPGGVGRAREPQVYLKAGDTVDVSVTGIGTISSGIVEAQQEA